MVVPSIEQFFTVLLLLWMIGLAMTVPNAWNVSSLEVNRFASTVDWVDTFGGGDAFTETGGTAPTASAQLLATVGSTMLLTRVVYTSVTPSLPTVLASLSM